MSLSCAILAMTNLMRNTPLALYSLQSLGSRAVSIAFLISLRNELLGRPLSLRRGLFRLCLNRYLYLRIFL